MVANARRNGKHGVEFNYGRANDGRPAPHSLTSSNLGAMTILGRILMKTDHSVRRLFAVHLVPNGKALVNSVGHVRNENEQ